MVNISFNNISNDIDINSIIAALVVNNLNNGNLQLQGGTNAAPTGQGILDVATLQSRGWSVTTN